MPKRIVVEPGGTHCLNMGDVAMMQVAVTRLGDLWPGAEIEVVTARPDLLSRYCPSAAPISAAERNAWLSGQSLIGAYHRMLPTGISAAFQKLERSLWLHSPQVTDVGIRLKTALTRRRVPSPSNFRKHLTRASLLVVSGMGAINDAFADCACPLLDELEFVIKAGVPVFAFGQGIGPIKDPILLAKARTVLPRLTMITLREGRTGLPLLLSLGVPKERIHVTGDDAVEPAYIRHPASLGNAIGVNLRLAAYAGTDEEMISMLREALRGAAAALKSPLVPVPISFHDEDSDLEANARLIDGLSTCPQTKIEGPEDVIRLIGDCRVVVTGSYHGGLFALAQGIPVVGLLRSAYYEQKFTGLQQQFPGGCRVIDFRQPVTPSQIEESIRDAWESAVYVREQLLDSAARQVELSRAAYRAVCATKNTGLAT